MTDLISVLTPTYNRENTLHRNFNSLMQSEYKHFEWIILDDGSTDNTSELVKELTQQADFPIRYYYQENKGKHVALNRLYDLAEGRYCFQLDSDDEILPNAMQKALTIWNQLAQPEKYWAVCGRCIDQRNKLLVGDPFPENINQVSFKQQRKMLSKISGELWSLQKTEVVKQYKFPEIEKLHYVSESYIWNQITFDYQQWYTDEYFRVYYRKESEKQLSNKARDSEAYRITAINNRLMINKFVFGKYAALVSIKKKLMFFVYYLHFSIKNKASLRECLNPLVHKRSKGLAFCLYYPVKWIVPLAKKT